jgi:hypothetical protein
MRYPRDDPAGHSEPPGLINPQNSGFLSFACAMVELPMIKDRGIINCAVFQKLEESSDFILCEVVGVT